MEVGILIVFLMVTGITAQVCVGGGSSTPLGMESVMSKGAKECQNRRGSTPPLLPAPPSTGIICHVLSGFFAHIMTLNTVLSVQSRVACAPSVCLSVWPSLLLLKLSLRF